jgi:hypothetical protein
MNISQQESSNEVRVYEVGDSFMLIDTPGLFGFKEKFNADLQEMEKYKDITRKYVSEAHLVLYVMNSTNPIKESHKEELNWLFRILNLLPRTVFVLSRFDEVADVEDDTSYTQNLNIKRSNVEDRLREAIDVSDAEVAALSIVAVAANPFDMGLDYWLAHLEQFKKFSHIAVLQQATAQKIRSSGGSDAIVRQARESVIRDVLNKELPVAVENDQRLGTEVERLAGVSRHLNRQLGQAELQISEVRSGLRDFVSRYFSGLILQVKGLSLETFSEFYERKVGAGGVMMAASLQNEFERQLGGVNLELGRMRLSIDAEVNHFNTMVGGLGKQGLGYVIKGNFINSESVKLTRDGIVAAANALGFDLGKALNFKPWGAVNLANNINNVLVAASVIMEVYDIIEHQRKEKIFHETVREMVENFEHQRDELLSLINDESFQENFFPDFIALRGRADDVQEAIRTQTQQRAQFQAWRESGELIQLKMDEDL